MALRKIPSLARTSVEILRRLTVRSRLSLGVALTSPDPGLKLTVGEFVEEEEEEEIGRGEHLLTALYRGEDRRGMQHRRREARGFGSGKVSRL